MSEDTPIAIADSVTQRDAAHRGAVLVAGSHGGLVAGRLAALSGALAVVLNDAGIGRERAGVAALDYLENIGMAAATVAHTSARIGDGADMLARGLISQVNATAARLGVVPGQRCAEAVEYLRQAPPPKAKPQTPGDELCAPLARTRHGLAVWGLDSASLVRPEHAGCIVVTGSHGGLPGRRPEAALRADAAAAVFNDAGVGMEQAGITRLPVLAERGIPAATVDCWSARIGDARSAWDSGRLSHVNACARNLGARAGMTVTEFAGLIPNPAR